jgi:signal transduction histidine kinase
MLLDIPDILLGVAIAANLVVVWFVYERDRNNPVNQLFAFFVFFIALWGLVILLFRTVAGDAVDLTLIRLSYISALILALCFYRFALVFPTPAPITRAHRVATDAIVIAVSIGLLIPGFIAREIVAQPWGKQVILNPLGWSIFAAVFLFLFVGGQVRLLMKVPPTKGPERTQLLVIATTVIIVGIFGMVFNLLLPSPFLEDFRYIWAGPLLTFAFAVVMTYAIFRYRLFNARAAVSELLVFALVLVLLIRVLLAGGFGEWWLDASVLAVASVLGALLIGSVNRDIRQRELIEKQKEAIERASAEKSEFMSFASHEIRNPVTAIRGYASLMLEGNMGALDPTVRDTIGKMSTLSEDVLNLIAQYLAKSKAELGQIRYEMTAFNLAATAREIAEAMRPQADKKGLTLRVVGGEGVELPVRADLGKTKEVIRNLIDNAVKYTPAGSITVSIEQHGGVARLRVTDTGTGISSEVLPLLFSKFSRADTKGENPGGSGIGLYLAKLFVEAQGGTIRAESLGVGNGSTFTIELPLAGDVPLYPSRSH